MMPLFLFVRIVQYSVNVFKTQIFRVLYEKGQVIIDNHPDSYRDCVIASQPAGWFAACPAEAG